LNESQCLLSLQWVSSAC